MLNKVIIFCIYSVILFFWFRLQQVDLFIQRKMYLFIQRGRLNVYLIISERCNLILWVFNSVGQSPDHFDVEFHYEKLWFLPRFINICWFGLKLLTWCVNWHKRDKSYCLCLSCAIFIIYMEALGGVVFVLFQVIIPEDLWPLISHHCLPHTHTLHLPPHTSTTTANTWLYQNSGVWFNYKESQIWYWTIPEVETLLLFDNFRRNFSFKISKPVCSQWLPESPLWTFLFEIENSFQIWRDQISSPILDLCSDCCLLFLSGSPLFLSIITSTLFFPFLLGYWC